MAYQNNPQNRFSAPQRPRPAPQQPPEITALSLPDDYVDEAEKVIRRLAENRKKITTSKIRNLLSLVSDIYNVENLRDEPQILPESRTALTMLRIRVVYEAGRDQETVGEFVKEAKLLQYIKGIGYDREKLIAFAHYMEALVAYHRYLIGGREG